MSLSLFRHLPRIKYKHDKAQHKLLTPSTKLFSVKHMENMLKYAA